MFDITLRRLKDCLARPISRTLPTWVTPNIITFMAFIVGLSACYSAAFFASASWPLFLWLLNRILDGVDGSLARERQASTELGGFLDLLGDFIVYSLLPFAIAYGQDLRKPMASSSVDDPSVDWRAVAILEASFHINNFVLFYCSAVVAKRQEMELTSVTMRPALIEGFESGLFFTAMLMWPRSISIWSWSMSAAVALSTGQRVWFLAHVLKKLDGPHKPRHRKQETLN